MSEAFVAHVSSNKARDHEIKPEYV